MTLVDLATHLSLEKGQTLNEYKVSRAWDIKLLVLVVLLRTVDFQNRSTTTNTVITVVNYYIYQNINKPFASSGGGTNN